MNDTRISADARDVAIALIIIILLILIAAKTLPKLWAKSVDKGNWWLAEVWASIYFGLFRI